MDKFNLQRFLKAQDTNVSNYAVALEEIKNGRKITHWIWYIFPQIEGLGYSPASEFYAISGLDEARAYFAHPTLKERLIEISNALLAHQGKSAFEIMGSLDGLKVRSSMTLFSIACPNEPVFEKVLEVFFNGEQDPNTIRILNKGL